MKTDIFYTIGSIVIYMSAGLVIGTIAFWAIEKFIRYTLINLKLYKILIDFMFDYKKFKEWKENNKS